MVEGEYKILNMLDFTSKRKYRSVIVRDEEGSNILLCKRADHIIFDRQRMAKCIFGGYH